MRWIFPARVPDPRDYFAPVHDGDTLWLTLDRGYGDRSNHAERLKLVFAPELKDPGGSATYWVVANWLRQHAPGTWDAPRWPLAVETFTTRTGNDITTLGRYVAMVYAGDPEEVRDPVREPVMPCLNRAITEYLAEHPEWGGGIGG